MEFIKFQYGIFLMLWPYIQLTWWIWLPPALFWGAWEMWKLYLRVRYFHNLRWVLLEVRIPKDIAKPPQAMEQIFAGIHSAHRNFDFEEKYWQGLQTDYFSFEIVSIGGQLHFYVYTPVDYKTLLQSLIYAQYPESEIREADDYMEKLPAVIPNDEWNLFGTEFALAKPDAYPIRTYKEFLIEDISLKEEARKVDPLSALAEVMASINPHEMVAIHFLIRPCGDGWRKAGEDLAAKLIGKDVPVTKSALEQFLAPLLSIIWNIFFTPTEETTKKKESKREGTLAQHLSPGEREVIEAIERNISKIGFETILRFAYIGKAKEFNMMNFAAIQGCLRQFNTLNLNSFKTQSKGMTTAKWYNPWKLRVKHKRKRFFYRHFAGRKPFIHTRTLKSKPFVFNIEELATVYHYPGGTVGAFTTQRIDAKRGEAPQNLPI